MQPRSFFQFTHALCRAIDPSLASAALRLGEASSSPQAVVDVAAAHRQHAAMVTALKRVGVSTVIELPSDDLPDSVFVEDTAVVGGDGTTVFLTTPGAPSRRLETARIKQALEQHFGGTVTAQQRGTLDGGDVLFTGREVFVGRSQRTDAAGIAELQRAFPAHSVTAVDVTHGAADGVLHLKSACSMAGDDHIVTGGPVGEHIRRAIEAAAPGRCTLPSTLSSPLSSSLSSTLSSPTP